MARLIVAALINWGLAPTIVTIFMKKLPSASDQLHPSAVFAIFLPAGVANGSPGSKTDLLGALTDPSFHFSRITVNQGIIRDIPGHHRPRSDERVPADRIAANDGRIGANG